MSGAARPFWRGVRARVLLVVVAAGLATVAVETIAVVALVQHDKEAWVSDRLVREAVHEREIVEDRVALARAELGRQALAARAGDLRELSRPASRHAPSAVLILRGREEVWAAAVDDASLAALRAAPGLDAGEVVGVGPSAVRLALGTTDGEVRGLVPLELGPPEGWRSGLSPARGAPGSVLVTTDASGERLVARAPISDGLAVAIEAPLGPARDAAFAISRQVVLWSILALGPLFLLAWVFSRRVTSPLRRLAQAVVEARGADVVVPGLDDDEIGDVGAAIRRMSRALRAHIAGLRSVLRFSRGASPDDSPETVLPELAAVLLEVLPGWRLVRDGEPVEDAVPIAWDDARYGALAPPDEATPTERGLGELFARTAARRVHGAALSRAAALDEKLRTLGQLAASVAHEMNTPLAFVKANLLALEQTTRGEDERAMIEDATVGVDRLVRIVRDLSAASSGGAIATREAVSMRALVTGMIRMARSRRPLGEVTVRAPDEAVVSCDRGRIEQVVLNLVNNALDAAGPDGHVEVRVEAGRDGVRVEVEDDGPGVPAEVRARLFEAFFTTKAAEGTGLGLYISRSFAEAHGGGLTLERSEPGRTIFALTLPLGQPADEPVESPDEEAVTERRARLPRVLVVDDDPQVVRAMIRWLKRRADVFGTTDPLEAIARASTGLFDLVLSDLRMPAMSGVELALAIREACGDAGPRVVVVTGSDGDIPDDVPHLRKPLDDASLEALLGAEAA